MRCYGWGPPGFLESIFGPLDYGTFVGLWLNRHLALAQDGPTLVRAIGSAFSGKPDRLLTEAEADDKEEAAALHMERAVRALEADALRGMTGG